MDYKKKTPKAEPPPRCICEFCPDACRVHRPGVMDARLLEFLMPKRESKDLVSVAYTNRKRQFVSPRVTKEGG